MLALSQILTFNTLAMVDLELVETIRSSVSV